MAPRLAAMVCLLALSACGAAPAPGKKPASGGPLTVYAAASLTGAFTRLGGSFEADHPDVRVIFNFAGSQQLAQQLAQGAPADVFASANAREMQNAVQAKRVSQEAVQVFARNELVVVIPKENPAHIESLQDLARPGLELDLAGKEVPAGGYALQFLEKASRSPKYGAGYQDAVLKNVVSYEDNVKTVLSKVLLGEVDAGIVYRSDIAPENEAKLSQIAIPPELNVTAEYPIAPVSDSAQPALAQAFVDLVRSEQGQKALEDYGFLPAR